MNKQIFISKLLLPIYRVLKIRPTQKKIKKATMVEWEHLQNAIKSGNKKKIIEAGVIWNQALLKFHQRNQEL